MYKVLYNLIFYPTPIFENLHFLPRNVRPPPLFTTWYSSQQPRYYREDDIASPFPFLYVIFFPTAMIFPSRLYNLIFFPNNRLDKLPLSFHNPASPTNYTSEYSFQYTLVCLRIFEPRAGDRCDIILVSTKKINFWSRFKKEWIHYQWFNWLLTVDRLVFVWSRRVPRWFNENLSPINHIHLSKTHRHAH